MRGGRRFEFRFFIPCAMALLAACSPGKKTSSAEKSTSVPVAVVSAQQKDIPVQLGAIGNVRPYSTISIRSRVDGQLQKASFKEGDYVNKGQLVFTIDPRPFEAALDQAKAVLARDLALATNAVVSLRRNLELAKSQIIAPTELDQSRANADAARATVVASEEAVKSAELQLSYCYIRSPVDGRVGVLLANEGNMIKNNDTIMAIINQVKPINIDFSVPEKELLNIRRYMEEQGGLKTEATIPNDNSPPQLGELSVINNTVDPATGTILLRSIFSNPNEKLWPGQFVDVKLTLTIQRDAVVVPSQAIQVSQEGKNVFVVRPDSTVEARPVVTGRQVGSEIVIEKGLKPHERVVTSGQLRLVSGMKVRIQTNAPVARDNLAVY